MIFAFETANQSILFSLYTTNSFHAILLAKPALRMGKAAFMDKPMHLMSDSVKRGDTIKDTVKLYQKQVYQKATEARVLACITDSSEIMALGGQQADSSICLVLDQTVFFPEGGGQPCDLGTIGSMPVLFVFEKTKVVYHQILPDNLLSPDQLIGSPVDCRLDWDRRFLHMQRHCGEHILSAAFYDLCGGINRGFHMGEEYMTIDIRPEGPSELPAFNDDLVAAAELLANRMIWDNLPVSTRYFRTKEEAAGLPMRKELNVEEDITLVCVGDENKAAGCVACCGTHPSTTGQVGLIKIIRWENYKGMYRITFDAGSAALAYCREQGEVLKTLGLRYSSDIRGLIGKIDAREQKERDVRQELYNLKQVYLHEQKEEIRNALAVLGQSKNGQGHEPLVREYSALKPDDLAALSRLLPWERTGLVLLVASCENTVILGSSGSPDCAKIVKDNAGVWNGKGGGRPDNARAMFSSRQDLDCFLDFVKKAYC